MVLLRRTLLWIALGFVLGHAFLFYDRWLPPETTLEVTRQLLFSESEMLASHGLAVCKRIIYDPFDYLDVPMDELISLYDYCR